MLNRKGLTLIEIIIAIALLGILAVGILPAFTSQLMIMNKGKEITGGAFNAQSVVEDAIQTAKSRIQNGLTPEASAGWTSVSRTLFGRTVQVQRLETVFPGNSAKSIFVYLSSRLAEIETRSLLTVANVRIDVTDDANDSVADMKKPTPPTLIGLFDDNSSQPGFFANLYGWYVSHEGIADPIFPADYTRISFAGADPQSLTDLLNRAGANRYVVFTATPVDIHGVRGAEVASTRVLVLGTEWRSGTFPWIDKNNNENWEAADLQLQTDKIKSIFDSSLLFPNPANPSVNLDPSGGSLVVPMQINDNPGNPIQDLTVSDAKEVNWMIDRSILLAKGIAVTNGTNMSLATRDGNITLYQHVKLDASGNAKYGDDGKVETTNTGPKLSTAGDITLKTHGRGTIGINDYSWLEARDINMTANGPLYVNRATVKAGSDILMDTTQNIGITGTRNMSLNHALIELKNNAAAGRKVTLKSRNALGITDTEIKGNGTAASTLILSAKDSITLTRTTLTNIDATVDINATMLGGGWSLNKTITVPDGKTLTFGTSSGRVNNAGSLNLGNTGAVTFNSTMGGTLQNPLTLSLNPTATENVLSIHSNYGRNIGYAGSSGPTAVTAAGVYQNLGTGQTNLSFTANKNAGSITNLNSLTYEFDGTGSISIAADASGAVNNENVELRVKDKYASDQIVGAINFTIYAPSGGGPATIIIQEPVAPVYVDSITVNSGTDEVYVDGTLQMTATVHPAEASQTVSWAIVGGANYGSINESTGVLMGINPGVLTVRATATDGTMVYGEKTITVRPVLVALGQVGNVQLSTSGIASWNDVTHANGFRLQLYKDGNPSGDALDVPISPLEYNFLSAMRSAGAGNYTVRVTARGDNYYYSNGPASNHSTPPRLIQHLAQVGGLNWDESRERARWNDISYENGYSIDLFKNSQPLGITAARPSGSTFYDFSTAISANGSGSYQFKVKGVADPAGLYLDSQDSGLSEAYSVKFLVREWDFSSNSDRGWYPGNHVTSFDSSGQGGTGHIRGSISGIDPFIYSGNDLDIGISSAKTIEIRMLNSSDATLAQIYFVTDADQGWNEAKHKNFAISANQSGYTNYTIDMSDVPGWSGVLRQLRLDPATGVTEGSFRIDYVQIY